MRLMYPDRVPCEVCEAPLDRRCDRCREIERLRTEEMGRGALRPHAPDMKPCRTCGTPTDRWNNVICDECWDLERRLGEYLRRGGARACVFVASALATARRNLRSKA